MHVYGHDIADSWLLKDDTEANDVTESDNEFHSVKVLAAKDFWNRVEVQRELLLGSRSSSSDRSITQNQIEMIHRHRHMFVQDIQKGQSADTRAFFEGIGMELL